MELINIYINMVRINKIMRVLFGFLTLVLLLGCPLGAPHYYNYRLLKKEILKTKTDSIKLIMDISSNHLSGNKINLWNNISIINLANHPIEIENI